LQLRLEGLAFSELSPVPGHSDFGDLSRGPLALSFPILTLRLRSPSFGALYSSLPRTEVAQCHPTWPLPAVIAHRPLICHTPPLTSLQKAAYLLRNSPELQDLMCSWTNVPKLAELPVKAGHEAAQHCCPRLAQGCGLS
jgi:hypothetical protein